MKIYENEFIPNITIVQMFDVSCLCFKIPAQTNAAQFKNVTKNNLTQHVQVRHNPRHI